MHHILVVDDSATMRRMIMASLRSIPDSHFIQASNGLEALEQLALSPVHLMTLDLNMPDMHGIEVVQFVRSHQRYHSLPIIVLTTRGDEASQATLLSAGASAYLTKPFQPQVLSARAAALLHAPQSTPVADQ